MDIIKLQKGICMTNKIRTSKKVAKKASKQLRSSKTSKIQKSVAASALRNRAKRQKMNNRIFILAALKFERR